MLLNFKKIIDKSTKHFDSPSEKVLSFIFVILLSWMLHYAAYQHNPTWFKTDAATLGKEEPTIIDFGWFSTFASFGFYFGEIIPKSPIRGLILGQVLAVWYIMLS